MKRTLALALAFAAIAHGAGAEGLKSSPLPKPRPVAAVPTDLVTTVSTANAISPLALFRPRPRPVVLAVPEPQPEAAPQLAQAPAVAPMLRPRARPAGLVKGQAVIEKAALVRVPQDKKSLRGKKGSVCGDPDIRGEVLAPVVSRVKGCGIADPVKVTSISGVKFSQPATITCDTAKAAKKWIERGLQPQFGKTPVVQLQIAGSYSCRPRNSIRGNKISEHGKGRALDIGGLVLANGTRINVAGGYYKSKGMKAAHKAACGIFGTTLGPGSDGHHEDHLHFDVARYRSGAYCR
ncbi:extensin family protein [Gemmobacter lutimaris]|uniref:Extensin family protein n=1 Tax=Gemmobacter lutimaris TaxID=2306023 RepID=A0A398BY40_9RHOB|nr:extensin family protein [Gemmobacter lutimaris]RID92136.1 extensin family protein [Gemmobacter lutimaris]